MPLGFTSSFPFCITSEVLISKLLWSDLWISFEMFSTSLFILPTIVSWTKFFPAGKETLFNELFLNQGGVDTKFLNGLEETEGTVLRTFKLVDFSMWIDWALCSVPLFKVCNCDSSLAANNLLSAVLLSLLTSAFMLSVPLTIRRSLISFFSAFDCSNIRL